MMISCLRQSPPVAQSAGTDIKSVDLNDTDERYVHCKCSAADLPASGSVASCASSFISEFRRVSSSLISGTASGSFRSNGAIAVSPSVERFATSCAHSTADQPQCERGVAAASGEIGSITVDDLASSIDQDADSCTYCRLPEVAVVVDCRGFVSFNTNHVVSAFNASCGDRFARKRLMEGKATVADLVSGGSEGETSGCNARERYRRLMKAAIDMGLAIVAYDDDSTDLTRLPVTHPLRVITENLKKTGAVVKYLFGGLQAFHAAYPFLCSKPNDPPSRPLLYSPTTPIVEMDVDSAKVSEILPYLFIGNERDAASRQLLEEHAVTHVLNVTSHAPLHFENEIVSKRIPATDNGRQNLKQYFEDAITFIESARCSGNRVLVHCQAGVSRSPTIVLAYLMARYNWPMMTAFNFVKSRRHIIAPNFNFMGQLMEFEQRCASGELRHCLRDDVPPLPVPDVPQDSS